MGMLKESIPFLLILMFGGTLGSENLRQHPTMRNSIRILDFNVWSGLDYIGYTKMGEFEPDSVREKRYQAFLSQIKQLDPDIIGIHEANKLPGYAKRLAKTIEYDFFYHVGLGGIRLGPIGLPWNLREGDVILTKKDLNPQFIGRRQLSGGYVGNWATFHFSDATQILAVKITVQTMPIYVFATHWHSSLPNSSGILTKLKELYDTGQASQKEYERVLSKIRGGVAWRLSESEKTIEFIQKTAKNHPFILIGDFNTEPGSQEIRNLLESGMVDIFQVSNPDSSGFTWDPETNLNHRYYNGESPAKDVYDRLEKFFELTPKRIDYIFLGPGSLSTPQKLSIKSSKIVMKEVINGVQASYHYGIFAEIEVR